MRLHVPLRAPGKILYYMKSPLWLSVSWSDNSVVSTDIFTVSEGYFKFVDTDWDYDGQFGKSSLGPMCNRI